MEQRIAAKGIILRDSKVLLIRGYDDAGDWYMLPGGGCKPGETLPEALVRECREELATVVTVGELLHVREFSYTQYKGSHLERLGREVSQVDCIFSCQLAENAIPHKGEYLDSPKVDITLEVEWLPLDSLAQYRIYPAVLQEILLAQGEHPVYLGECY